MIKIGLDNYLVIKGAGGLRGLLDRAEDPLPPTTTETRRPANEVDPFDVATSIVKASKRQGLPGLCSHCGTMNVFRGSRWQPVSEDDMKSETLKNLTNSFSNLSPHYVTNVIEHIRAQVFIPESTELPTWLAAGPKWPAKGVVAFRNGLLHLDGYLRGDSEYFVPPTPALFGVSVLPYDFRADAGTPTNWLKFLSDLWPNDPEAIALLQEWMGYVVSSSTAHHKILTLIGPPRAGKGVISNVLAELVGRDNVAGPTFSSLSSPFGLSPLLGKSLAIIDDARLSRKSDAQIAVERILTISGGGALDVDRKNRPLITVKLPCRLMIVSNELPELPDTSQALAKRLMPLRLSKSFYGHEDHDLFNKLKEELPRILLWALEGCKRLRDQGRFTVPESSKELQEDFADLSSPISAFLSDVCDLSDARSIDSQSLYTAWSAWCLKMGRDPGKSFTFGRDLRAAIPGLRTEREWDGDGAKKRRATRYHGVGLL